MIDDVQFMSYEEIMTQIKELCEHKDKLERQMRADRESLFNLAVEKWKPLVGMCFKFNNTNNSVKDYMFVITDVPQKEHTMMETIYNRYQLPVFIINKDGITRNTVITSYAVDADDVYAEFTKKFEPISHEDFLIEVGDIISSEIIEKAVNKYNK